MSDSLRVAVIGVGYLGRIHAKIYAQMADVDLVGVVDHNEKTAKDIGDLYRCAAYIDHNALINEVDAVSIVVPTSAHKDVAMPFLKAGKHVLLEKPIAPTVQDAEIIVDCAEKSEATLLIGHLERFNAGIMALADRVTSPRFIEVHRLGTFVERATDVDVVTDLMIHDIDIVLSLVKSELTYVSAVGSPVVTDHVDIANARLEFVNNIIANVTASRVSNKKFRRIRVFGADSYQALNYLDQQIDVVRKTEALPGQKFPGLATETIKVTQCPPLDAELEHFVEIIRNNGKPLVSGHDGLKALHVAEQVKDKINACLA